MTAGFLESPRRAHTLVVKAGGDTVRDLADELRSLANRVERGELTKGCGGGCSRSSIYEYLDDGLPTRDAYFKAVDEWLGRKRQ